MMNKYSKIYAFVLVLAFAMPALAAPSVTRSLSSSAISGSTISVNLTVVLDGSSYYAIDEILPNTNWTVTGASNSGDYSLQPGHVKWICFQDCTNITLSYNVTIPVAAVGAYTFSGTYAMENINETTIGGANSITVSQPIIPDFTIVPSTNTLSIAQSSSGTMTVALTSVGGFSNLTNLTALNVPSGVSITFSPDSSMLNFSSSMSVSVGSSVSAQTYTIIIRGRSVGHEHNITLSLTVTSPGASFPPSGGGGGAVGGAAQPQVVVVQDAANLSIVSNNNMSANTSVKWAINQPSKIPVTYVNISVMALQQNVLIRMQSYATKLTGLDNISGAVYKWIGVTPSIADANITAVRIGFAVPNSWVTTNSINETTVALYRYTGTTANKLNTSWLSKDANWTYYEAISPGLSFFAIAGPLPGCPAACSEPSNWSSCVAGTDGVGRQNRIEYECNTATNYTCRSKVSTQNCCPTCTTAGNWSNCANAKQNRNAYRCSDTTGYKCESYNDEQACVDAATAGTAIARAQIAINNARQSGKDVTSAEYLLEQARNALTAQNYESAQNFAVQAESAATVALPLPVTGMPLEIIIVVAAIVVAGVVIMLMLKRRKSAAPTAVTNICVVCGEPTTLQTRCSNCGRYACIKHLQTIAGRPYCSNCVRRMYGQNV